MLVNVNPSLVVPEVGHVVVWYESVGPGGVQKIIFSLEQRRGGSGILQHADHHLPVISRLAVVLGVGGDLWGIRSAGDVYSEVFEVKLETLRKRT